MMTPIKLINTAIASSGYRCFCDENIFTIYFLSNCQVHNAILLTIITVLHFRPPGPIHLITESFFPLTSISPLPTTHTPQPLVTTVPLSASMSLIFF